MSLGLYLHVPFCVKKCNYCSFVSLPREDHLVSAYLKSLKNELKMYSDNLSETEKELDSIFIGGGTPTSLSVSELEEILENIQTCFYLSKDAEITVEANPDTVERQKLVSLKNSGVNRLSFGFQSCQNENLVLLGRTHTFSEAVCSYQEAREVGFDNINIDLIYGIPGQLIAEWSDCLREIISLSPEHISAYGLQLEEGTPLYKKVSEGELEQCPEDTEADMYQILMDMLKTSGYIHYEISNFAKPGRSCRHNLRYWHNQAYLGLGPAAHSYLRGERFANHLSVNQYIESLMNGQSPVCSREVINRDVEMSETVFLGLRLIEGLDTRLFNRRFGISIEKVYSNEIKKLTRLGLLEKAGPFLRLTNRGLMLGNMVFSEFIKI